MIGVFIGGFYVSFRRKTRIWNGKSRTYVVGRTLPDGGTQRGRWQRLRESSRDVVNEWRHNTMPVDIWHSRSLCPVVQRPLPVPIVRATREPRACGASARRRRVVAPRHRFWACTGRVHWLAERSRQDSLSANVNRTKMYLFRWPSWQYVLGPRTIKWAPILVQKNLLRVFEKKTAINILCICVLEIENFDRFNSNLAKTFLSTIAWTMSLAKRIQ